MARDRLRLMDRLLRLRKLDEERDATRLAARAREHADAVARTADADAAVAAVGPWKACEDGRNGLDLERYRQAMAVEALAMDLADAARDAERKATSGLHEATEDYARTAAQRRVSTPRRARVEQDLRRGEEVRESDRLADLIAARRGAGKP